MSIMPTVKKWQERFETFSSLLVTLTALPFIGKFISGIFGKDNNSTTNTEINTSGKGLGENLILSVLKNELEAGEVCELEKLEDDLATDTDRGKERLTAFQVYLAKLVKENSKQQKKTKKPKKGEEAPEEETSFTELAIEVGKKFVIRIIGKPTYPERKIILEREGVFSELPKPRVPYGPVIEFSRQHKLATIGMVLFIIPSTIIYLIVLAISSLF